MAEIEVVTLRDLLEKQIADGDSLRLDGERWGLNVLVADFLDLRGAPESAALHLLRLSALARSALPFDWLAVLYGTEREALEACQRAYGYEMAKPPRSVFLPTLLEVLAYDREPWLLNQIALERLHAHLQCAWSLMQRESSFLYAGSWLVRKACRLYAPAGAPDAAIVLLHRTRALVENHLAKRDRHTLSLHESNVHIARLIHDLLWDYLDVEQPLTREERVAALGRELGGEAGLSPEAALDAFGSALAGWEGEAKAKGWSEDLSALHRHFQLDLEFRQLLARFAQAEAIGAWPEFPYRELESLADRYEAADRSPAKVLCLTLGHISYCCRKKPEHAGQFREATERIAGRLEKVPERWPVTPPLRDEVMRRLVECFLRLRNPERARPFVTAGLTRIAEVLPAIADGSAQSYVLRGSEDWVGFAYLISSCLHERPGPDRYFDEMYRVMHQRRWSGRPAPKGGSLLQASVSRPCVVLRASGGDKAVETSTLATHECFVTLQRISEAATRDLAQFRDTNRMPDKERDREWRDLAGRLFAQLPLRELSTKLNGTSDAPRGILVETELSGLHIPWCGLLAESAFRTKAVLVADLTVNEERRGPLPAKDTEILILNCFAQDESLYDLFRHGADAIGARHVRCESVSHYRDELRSRPCRLIVTVGHGSQERFLGHLALQIGGTWSSAEEVWKDVRLACGSVVASFTCYGGGGPGSTHLNSLISRAFSTFEVLFRTAFVSPTVQNALKTRPNLDALTLGGGLSAATGDFGSVASLALRAGAQAAVVSRWPAWVFPATADHYLTLFTGLAPLAPQGDVWGQAEVVMRFITAMRAWGLWNSLGWGISAPAQLALPGEAH